MTARWWIRITGTGRRDSVLPIATSQDCGPRWIWISYVHLNRLGSADLLGINGPQVNIATINQIDPDWGISPGEFPGHG